MSRPSQLADTASGDYSSRCCGASPGAWEAAGVRCPALCSFLTSSSRPDVPPRCVGGTCCHAGAPRPKARCTLPSLARPARAPGLATRICRAWGPGFGKDTDPLSHPARRFQTVTVNRSRRHVRIGPSNWRPTAAWPRGASSAQRTERVPQRARRIVLCRTQRWASRLRWLAVTFWCIFACTCSPPNRLQGQTRQDQGHFRLQSVRLQRVPPRTAGRPRRAHHL